MMKLKKNPSKLEALLEKMLLLSRNKNKSLPPLNTEAKELAKASREGKAIVVASCCLNPSGCFDIGKALSTQFSLPFIRVQSKTYFGMVISRDFLDKPISNSTNSTCESVIFTGCGLENSSLLSIVETLSKDYQFTGIKHICHIVPPHHAFEEQQHRFEQQLAAGISYFKTHSKYQFRLLHSGLDSSSPYNIGMPRFQLKTSEFKVPPECYGLIRHRFLEDFLLSVKDNKCSPKAEKYLNEYFSQVANAGKDCKTQPIIVIALGIGPSSRQEILRIAKLHSIEMDFCDQFNDYRLPQQEDFFKVLDAIKHKKGVVSFDSSGTQSALQALSFGVPVMIYQPIYSNPTLSKFYAQLVNLIPVELRLTANVLLGLSNEHELLKDRLVCQKTYEILQVVINNAHKKFEEFKSNSEVHVQIHDTGLQETKGLPEKAGDAKASTACQVFDRSFRINLIAELNRITGMNSVFSENLKRASIMVSDKGLRVEIIKHFKLHGIAIVENPRNNLALSLDCSLIRVSQLKTINRLPSLISAAAYDKEWEAFKWVRELR